MLAILEKVLTAIDNSQRRRVRYRHDDQAADARQFTQQEMILKMKAARDRMKQI